MMSCNKIRRFVFLLRSSYLFVFFLLFCLFVSSIFCSAYLFLLSFVLPICFFYLLFFYTLEDLLSGFFESNDVYRPWLQIDLQEFIFVTQVIKKAFVGLYHYIIPITLWSTPVSIIFNMAWSLLINVILSIFVCITII
jgi:hypothetical protein